VLTQDQLQAALARVRLVVLDVDGVLTDAGIFLSGNEEFKRYNSRDEAGIKYLLRHGVGVAVITGRESASVARWCAGLGISEVHQRQLQKLPVFLEILERHGLTPDEVAEYVEDLRRQKLDAGRSETEVPAQEGGQGVDDRSGSTGP